MEKKLSLKKRPKATMFVEDVVEFALNLAVMNRLDYDEYLDQFQGYL